METELIAAPKTGGSLVKKGGGGALIAAGRVLHWAAAAPALTQYGYLRTMSRCVDTSAKVLDHLDISYDEKSLS